MAQHEYGRESCGRTGYPKAPGLLDIDSYVGSLHTLFALDKIYVLRIGTIEEEPSFFVDKGKNEKTAALHSICSPGASEMLNWNPSDISREESDPLVLSLTGDCYCEALGENTIQSLQR